MFIDTHCHLSKEYYADIFQVLKENKEADVDTIIISGCDKESIKESLEYINDYSFVYATIGYHPSEVLKVSDADLEKLKKDLLNKKVVGVGEIGLDYHYGKEDRDKQIILFEKQLKIAEDLKMPVVIHSRDATKDTIDCLKKYKVTGIIHCYSGSLETAQEYIKLGYSFGIGGVITFKNSRLSEVVSKIPLDRIVLETDSPYLTPHPYRGEINSSKYLVYVAEKIAECKNISLEEVGKVTTENAKNIFRIS